jgi:hypothetical protein
MLTEKDIIQQQFFIQTVEELRVFICREERAECPNQISLSHFIGFISN